MIYREVVVNTNIYTVPDPGKVKYLSTPAQQMSPILDVSALTLNHIRHIQSRRNANNSSTNQPMWFTALRHSSPRHGAQTTTMHETLPDNWPTKPLYAPDPPLFTPL